MFISPHGCRQTSALHPFTARNCLAWSHFQRSSSTAWRLTILRGFTIIPSCVPVSVRAPVAAHQVSGHTMTHTRADMFTPTCTLTPNHPCSVPPPSPSSILPHDRQTELWCIVCEMSDYMMRPACNCPHKLLSRSSACLKAPLWGVD